MRHAKMLVVKYSLFKKGGMPETEMVQKQQFIPTQIDRS